ncbi:5'-deoxyadenosine deaminase [Salicibibacter cibarius]|uniref:5-methylthioadenosine/S-adenosylhomocysteine deaminase n=1 Tax=Salicibibacter cibarius TaxID=2743000 RepID=A0A7T6Z6D6_9BACI|nr:5'-deoxyadenosine deaminase [Salicibibacter cibarius]QQK77216.1 5'-deoxyadenosine deaminase [Salicibibacter cibarius]
MSKTLIKNAEIVTVNEENEIFYGDLLIDNDRISQIDSHIQDIDVDKVIDARHKTVIPGFIHTHIHLCQTLFRGQGDDLELLDWLEKRIWPLEASHDEESSYYSAMLGIGELIRSGTTSVVDMETVHHADSAFQAIATSGIRALSGKVMMDYGDEVPLLLQENTDTSIQESVDLLEKWHGHDSGRIQYAFSPRFVVSCSEDLLTEVRDLSSHYNVHVHSHAAENTGEIEIVENRTGMRNVVYLDHIGLANERLILAHCVWLNDEEKSIIKDRGVKVSHCPGSNLKLASGIADVPDMLDKQLQVSLGADGAPCNNNLNMLNEMRLAATIQKPKHGPTSMNAQAVLRMATIEGAKAVGMENEIGSLEVGKKADLSILDLNDFHVYPSFDVDPVSRIVYSATSSDIETTFINGTPVMEGRVMKTMDKNIVLKESNKSIDRLLKRVPTIQYS